MFDVRSFTLDTNCMLALAEARPEASAVRILSSAHAEGRARVAIVAISASEKQKGGGFIQNFREFRERLDALSLAHLDILAPMAYSDVTFFDWCLITDSEMEALERNIHAILFPNVEFAWRDHCAKNGLDVRSELSGRWRNCKCDVQAMWAHIHSKRDAFVTSDKNFHSSAKKVGLVTLGAGRIERPEDAIALI